MAQAADISASAVRRIWKAHGLQPNRWRLFKLSSDPQFVDKPGDVVGVYVNPPAHAIVLPVDEKSQIQALDHTQPGLPMKKGRLGTMTQDYKRARRAVIGRNMQRHRHQRFTFHFTLTSCSWLNAIKGFFAKLSKRRLKRGVFHSVVDLQAAINRFLAEHNRQPKPSPGPPIPTKLSPPSNVGTKC